MDKVLPALMKMGIAIAAIRMNRISKIIFSSQNVPIQNYPVGKEKESGPCACGI